MHDLLSNSALDLGFWSTGLGKMVQEPRARFHVPEWGVFCHAARLQNRPPRLKLVLSDSTQPQYLVRAKDLPRYGVRAENERTASQPSG